MEINSISTEINRPKWKSIDQKVEAEKPCNGETDNSNRF